MKTRGLIAAAVVLALLAGALYWSNTRKPTEDAAKASSDSAPNVLTLNRDDISKVEIRKKGGDDVVLSRSAPDAWQITAPRPFSADQGAIPPVISALSSVDAERIISDQLGDVKQYGLAEPELAVSATTKDGKTRTLLLGDDTPTGNSVYAMLSDKPRVFTVFSYTKKSLDKGVSDLRDKRLLPVDFNNIRSVEVMSPRLGMTFGPDNGQWTLQSPNDMRADTPQLQSIVDKLKEASLDPSASDADLKKNAAAFASGEAVATVKVTGASVSQELQVRRNNDIFYAKSSAADGVYKVPVDLGAELEKKLDDFRVKNLFDFDSDNPEKIEMHDGAKTYSLARIGEDWFANGKEIDGSSVEPFIDHIRSLAALKFVTSGPGKPAADLAVTSNGGKRVEKVLVVENNGHYVAKRDNAPLLYELDANAFEELEKSAGQIKLAELAKQ